MPTEAGRRSSPTGAVVAVLCLAGTTVSLQQTLVVALLPSFAELLSLSTDDVSWLITATLLTSAVATPVVARLADMYGKRLMMIVCIVLMAAGSLIADAWTPKSQVADFQDPDTPMIVHLGGPLLLTGTVTQAGVPVQGALLTLSATTGEVRATTASGADGSYLLRLPPPGHQILTVLGPDLRATRAVKIFTTTQSAICDIELEPSGSTADEP